MSVYLQFKFNKPKLYLVEDLRTPLMYEFACYLLLKLLYQNRRK